jgi:hypothetical protein
MVGKQGDLSLWQLQLRMEMTGQSANKKHILSGS